MLKQIEQRNTNPTDTEVPFPTSCNIIEIDLAGSCIESDKLDYKNFIKILKC